jgi:hypothetical protein
MLTPLPFSLHASLGCPPHADLAVSLAWELSDLDGHQLECGLDVLAAATLTDLPADPAARLTALGEPVTAGALRPRAHGGVRDLLIGDVVADGRGHPVALAVVLVEVARRAGIDVGIVAGDADHYLADQHSDEPWLLDPATGHVIDAMEFPRFCGHLMAGPSGPAGRISVHAVDPAVSGAVQARCRRVGAFVGEVDPADRRRAGSLAAVAAQLGQADSA